MGNWEGPNTSKCRMVMYGAGKTTKVLHPICSHANRSCAGKQVLNYRCNKIRRVWRVQVPPNICTRGAHSRALGEWMFRLRRRNIGLSQRLNAVVLLRFASQKSKDTPLPAAHNKSCIYRASKLIIYFSNSNKLEIFFKISGMILTNIVCFDIISKKLCKN